MARRSRKLPGVLLACVVIITTLLFFVFAPVQAATDRTINFSARLKTAAGTAVADGYYNIGFKLYTQAANGAAIWSENYYDINGTAPGQDYRVQVKNGYLNVKLGSRTAFGSSVNWNGDLWLAMEIGGTTHTGVFGDIPWDGEMTPRIQLGAVPNAMNAGSLDGKTADNFIQLGQGAQTNSSDNPSIHINNTGSGNLIQLQHNAEDVFTVNANGDITLGGNSDHTISIAASDANTDGHSLTIAGGNGGSGSNNGGNLVLSGGSGGEGGADGLVVLTTPTFATATNDSNCYAGGALVNNSCTVSQSTVDGSSAVILGFGAENQTATLPDPTITTPGRILYVMAANDSSAFTLVANGSDSMPMQPKSAHTMLWNGSDWILVGGAGSSGGNLQEPNNGSDITVDNGQTDGLTIEGGAPDQPIAIEGEAQTDTDEAQSTDNSTPSPEEPENTAPFQLDHSDSAPTADDDSALLGSMYYDTSIGKVQCYEASGWGACGDAPDTFVTVSPEYTNAVMNGNDIGVISSDICSDTLGINNGSNSQPAVCGTNETYNFYGWTTEEDNNQTRSIYLTYQLPDNFKGFVAGSTSVMGRTDSDNSSVSYQIYRDSEAGLVSCGSLMSIASGSQTSWQRGAASGGNDPSVCNFTAGDSILFRINLTTKDNANAYVSNVNFTFSNN